MVRSVKIQDLFHISLKAGAVSLPPLKQNCVKIKFKDEQIHEVYIGTPPIFPFVASQLYEANIAGWRRLSAESGDSKAIYEVSFDTTDSHFNFTPGDTIGVIPQNTATEVEDIIRHIDLQSCADQTYELTSDGKGKVPAFLPIKSTIRNVLTYCLDLRTVVKKLFLLALSKHTKEDTEKRILEYLCSKEGSAMYNSFILENTLCILDIFHVFKSCKPPIEVLLMNLPRLLPRPYSIVNSQTNSENVIKICFSVMELANKRKGLTTGFLEDILLKNSLEKTLENLSIQDENNYSTSKVKIYLRSNINGFRLPESKQNLLLIGPGTGVSPFIGFLEELADRKRRNMEIGETWLFFGCRDPKLDFIYEAEIQKFLNYGILNRFDAAFSRIDNGGVKYVQDAILNKSEEVANFIEDGAMIFVCGNQKTMASEVRKSLKTSLKYLQKSEKDSEKYIADLESSKKYINDIWS